MDLINEITAIPRIGDPAPAFDAVTTQGKIHFPVDFNGKWVILFSHPSDFTPVCTSELMTLGARAQEFEDLNCQLIGISIDGLYSHIAWLRTSRERIEYRGMKNITIRFPLIADLNTDISRKYGMLQPGESTTQTVRATFFIDPQNFIRSIIYYPMSLGRNFNELKRILIGLQTIDKFDVTLPADWIPGDDVIAPAANSLKAAEERMKEPTPGTQCYDWFFCLKKLPEK